MSKKNVMISVDEEIHKKALEFRLNVSELANEALAHRVKNRFKVEIDESVLACEFCGWVGRKATKEDFNGLQWLWPDERWICERCLRNKIRSVINGEQNNIYHTK